MACEKCWADAYRMLQTGDFDSQSEAYGQLKRSRPFGTCTPDEICGVGTTEMHTVHGGDTSCACGEVMARRPE